MKTISGEGETTENRRNNHDEKLPIAFSSIEVSSIRFFFHPFTILS
jgi:hypothetical protein